MTLRRRTPVQFFLAPLILALSLTSCGSDAAAPVTDAAAAEPTESTKSAAVVAPAEGIDLDLFFDGAVVGTPGEAACTLSEGTETTCVSVTIAGYPADVDIGPFCPETTAATAADVGIWFDGDSLYDVDGDFILALPEIYGDDNWQLHDEDGNVRVTDTLEAFEAAARPDVDPAYQNYCVQGEIAWLDNGEPIPTTVEIPKVPTRAASPTATNGSVGITLNGVILDGAAPVDAILSAYTIAVFDDCGGHVNPVAGYHIHGAAGCSEVGEAEAGETPIFAYALDGYPIHSPLDEAAEAAADLDACNGHTTEELGYHYHAGRTQSNAILSCFVGETAAGTAGGRGARPDLPAAPAEDPAVPEEAAAEAETGAVFVEHEAPTQASDYLDSYSLSDDIFGTMVSVTVDETTRTIVSNSLPDHDTGEFPNNGNPNTISAQSMVLTYPATPTWTGAANFAQMPGMAVNGIAFEPGTAETVTCASGEVYRIEGLQDLYNLGMDFNNAHVQPTGQYHYHGIADLLVSTHDTGNDLVQVGFAADGYLMYYSRSGVYGSSYSLDATARTGTDCVASGPAGGSAVAIEGSSTDGTYGSDWVFSAGAGDLDECNGTEIDGEYAYVLTDEFPFIPRCLNGEFTATGPGAGGGGQGGAPGGGAGAPGQGGGPDLSEAAESLGITVEELMAALGPPPPDFEAAAATLGISVEELEAVMPAPPG